MKNGLNGFRESKNVLFRICLVLGVALLGMMTIKSFYPKAEIHPMLLAIYPIVLGVYVLVKEALRWTGEKQSMRLGELLVMLWWAVLTSMVIFHFIASGWLDLDKLRFKIPGEAQNTFIEVFGIYACSELSKIIHKYKEKNNQGDRSEGKNKKIES